jgi:hypothetical protein
LRESATSTRSARNCYFTKVFIIRSAPLISLEAQADMRLRPFFFYALDNFKTS